MNKTKFACSALLFSALAFLPVLASAADGTQIGVLKCDVEGGVGMLLGSKKDMTCVFTKKDGTVENYKGYDLTLGLDVGVTDESHISWAVLAPSLNEKAGGLSGDYVGATAEVTVAGGVGANVLIGGGNSITLQPLSVQTQTGLNIAGGFGKIKLEYVN
jgi:hypothetical protein